MHGENILFPIIIGAIYLVSWLVRRGQNAADGAADSEPAKPEPRALTPTRSPARSEEERVRRFLEALGQPATNAPPRKIVARPAASGPLAPPRPPIVARELRRESARKREITPSRARRAPAAPRPPLAPVIPAETLAPYFPQIIRRPPAGERSLALATDLPVLGPGVPAENVQARRTPAPALIGAPKAELRPLLRSAGGLRQAVLLREIFGTPRGLHGIEIERF